MNEYAVLYGTILALAFLFVIANELRKWACAARTNHKRRSSKSKPKEEVDPVPSLSHAVRQARIMRQRSESEENRDDLEERFTSTLEHTLRKARLDNNAQPSSSD